MTASNSRMAFGVGTALSALAAALAVSCSDEFQDCTASRTCKPTSGGAAGAAASAGMGGTGGGGAGEGASGGKASGSPGGEGGEGAAAAGRGGSAPTDAGAAGDAGASGAGGDGNELPTTCERDAECNDKNACNGVETCEAGECAAGTPVECTSEQPEHCAASCETVDGEAVCGHEGLDADGDGHKSAACSLNAGDDCNDADAAVHPGAAEMCDGEDSDCDLNADADEDEVVVEGGVDVLVARDDPSQDVISASIAGFGEKATANPNSLFAVGWTYSFGDCKLWQTNVIANDASMTRVAGVTECNSSHTESIDVVTQPEVATTVSADPVAPVTYFIVNSTKTTWAGPSFSPSRSLSFKNSEYRVLFFGGGRVSNTVRRLGFTQDLELVRDEIVDPEGEHIALDGAQGAAVWTLRQSPTLDRVYADIGDGVVALSSESTSASHPLMAWSEDNAFAVAWRYADGRMRFKHFDDDCEIGVGDGVPGELTATPKGYVLVSLSENKREVVANLVGPSCKLGPHSVLARVDDGSDDELSDPKIGVTGSYLRAVWKRVTSDGTALESRQFRWDQCE